MSGDDPFFYEQVDRWEMVWKENRQQWWVLHIQGTIPWWYSYRSYKPRRHD